MSSAATTIFGTGVQRARQVRDWLLEELGAEHEWVFGSEDSLLWVSSPIGTYFRTEAAGDDTPGLGIVHVHTRLAYVEDLEAARAAVQDLNRTTTTSRWSVVGDEGPPGWRLPNAEQVESFDLGYPPPPDAETFYRNAIAPAASSDEPPSVDAGVSFVVGDADLELPLEALTLVVKEQIAKAVALVTNGFADGWGSPAILVDENDEMRSTWADVVHHYDRHVTPRKEQTEPRLLAALIRAFELQRQRQFETAPAAWFGSGDADGFTCEMPYGPGPFPMGVIGMRSAHPHLSNEENETSLFRGFAVPNPHVGEGLLLTLRLPVGHDREPAWWQADLLNAQTRITALGWSAAYAHGVGAWCVNEGSPAWSCFLPTYWAEQLDDEALTVLLARLLDNAARLSWGARRVLERDEDLQQASVSGHLPPPRGAAAGEHARGPEFGELPYGVDPGARVQGKVWETLVGGDDAWAAGVPGGFAFWTSRFPVSVTRSTCGCADSGSLVQISTVLAAEPTSLQVEAALVGHEAACGGAVVVEDGVLLLRTTLHAHDDLLHWMLDWAPALAVAQVRAAEALGNLAEGTPHPELGWRTDRDQFLELLDHGQSWLVPPGEPASTAALALAPVLLHDLPLGAAWDDDAPVLTWLLESDGFSGGALSTRYGRYDNALAVTVLRVQTDLVLPAVVDHVAWCLEQNQALTDGHFGSVTVIGGWLPTGAGTVSYRTEVPLALDRSTSVAAHSSWAATCLSHHVLAVRWTVAQNASVDLRKPTADEMVTEVSSWLDFYARVLEFPDGLSLMATPAAEGLVLESRHPVGAESAGTARLATTCLNGQGAEAVTHLVASIHEVQPALRLMHASLLGVARPDITFGRELRPLWDLGTVPNPSAIAYALTDLIEQGHLLASEDLAEGEYELSDGGLLSIAPSVHPAWGNVLQIDLRPATATERGEAGLGDWHEGVLHLVVPRVAFLPAHRWPYDVISLVVASALRQANGPPP